ncbi:MAG: hypothetical protein ING44_17785, partial [Telmatospirillum sp.]|nr:hypothetical protein [Telmatospirillum sp.]
RIPPLRPLSEPAAGKPVGGFLLFGNGSAVDPLVGGSSFLQDASGDECEKLPRLQYVPIAPPNPMGPLATAINVHFAAATPNFKILEYRLPFQG